MIHRVSYKMACLICSSRNHNVFHCDSEYAISMYKKTNEWIEKVLINLYSTEGCITYNNDCFLNIFCNRSYKDSIDWIVEEPEIKSLKFSDIMFLNNISACVINTEWTREQYLYIYLAIKTLQLYELSGNSKFSARARMNMKIDSDYWAEKTYTSEKEYTEKRARRMRDADAIEY